MPFPPSAACRFFDLPPVNLQNLPLHLTKNSFASAPTHLCGIALAIKEQWIDPSTGALTGTSVIDSYYTIKIPKGTTIYVGPADYQGGIYLGGAEQIFIEKPWLIDGVEIISNTPLN